MLKQDPKIRLSNLQEKIFQFTKNNFFAIYRKKYPIYKKKYFNLQKFIFFQFTKRNTSIYKEKYRPWFFLESIWFFLKSDRNQKKFEKLEKMRFFKLLIFGF